MSDLTGFDRSRVIIDLETGKAVYTSTCFYCGAMCEDCPLEAAQKWEKRHVNECIYRHQYARVNAAAAQMLV